MLKPQLAIVTGSLAIIVFTISARSYSNAQSGALVRLQPTSPGVAQSGHVHLAGKVLASQFVGSGSALTGVDAELLDGLNSTAFLQAVPNPLSLTGSVANAAVITGINTNSGTGGYGIRGESSNASTSGVGVWGETAATSGSGVSGLATSSNGRGVTGLANANNGVTFGGFFRANSPAGYGVYADSNGPYGVYARSDLTGEASYGGYFLATGTHARGVYSTVTSPTGSTYAGVFNNNSDDGVAVYAETVGPQALYGVSAKATGTAYGGYFLSDSTGGRGVFGTTSSTSAGSTPYGVRGATSVSTLGYAVYALGDMGASGVKPFRIDHPHDPENKYLLHYSSESPFPQNFYNGNVVTDEKGYAWVDLPTYFNDINTNFKYQLTVVDSSDDFVLAKVTDEISGNRFRIRSSAPRVKVSWMVFADRNDERVRFSRPTDVREKSETERGKYQHPEYFGMPASKGMDYSPKPESIGTGDGKR